MMKRARDARAAIEWLGDPQAGDELTRIKKLIPTVAQLFAEGAEWLGRDDIDPEKVYECFGHAFMLAADAIASLRMHVDRNPDLKKDIEAHLNKLETAAGLLLKDRRPPGIVLVGV